MSYRNSDGSITLKDVCVTRATYQHILDSVMSEYSSDDFIEEVLVEIDPQKREEAYRKLVFEAYVEDVTPLRRWGYHGSKKEATDSVYLPECVISKEAFEKMENTVWSYTDESVLAFEEEAEENRESTYITAIVEDYVREMAMSADLALIKVSDDSFDDVFSRYFY